MGRRCVNIQDTLLFIECITDLIFKNQANGSSDKPSGQFVNDLLRTEFHRLVSTLSFHPRELTTTIENLCPSLSNNHSRYIHLYS